MKMANKVMMMMIVMMTMKMMVIQTPREEVDNEDDNEDDNDMIIKMALTPTTTSANCFAIRILTTPVLLLSSAESIARNLEILLERRNMLTVSPGNRLLNSACSQVKLWRLMMESVYGSSLRLNRDWQKASFYLEKCCFKDWTQLLLGGGWKLKLTLFWQSTITVPLSK